MAQGKYKATKRFYQVCGELVHKKEQYQKLGNEKNNGEMIQSYRAQLAALKDKAVA